MTHAQQCDLARRAAAHVRAAAEALGDDRARNGRFRTSAGLVMRLLAAAAKPLPTDTDTARAVQRARAALRAASGLWWTLALSEERHAQREARKLRGFCSEDLVQEGRIGLYHAAIRFDPDRGITFSTYSRWWARAQITRAVEHGERHVRLTSTATNIIQKARLVAAQLEAAGEVPTVERLRAELVDEPGVTYLEETLNAAQMPASLEWSVSGTEGHGRHPLRIADTLEAESADLDAELDGVTQLARLRTARRRLPMRYRDVLTLRVDKGQTLAEAGEAMSLSRERVRQLEREATGMLREELAPAPAWAAK